MKSYKKLKTKKKIQDKRATIDELHEKKMKDFEDLHNSLPEREKTLNKLKKYLKTIDKNVKNYWDVEFNTKKDIERMEKEIQDIREQKEMLKYLTDVSHIFKKIADASEKTETKHKKVENDSLGKYVTIQEGVNKGSLLDEYVLACYGRMPTTHINTTDYKDLMVCKDCNEPLFFDTKECVLSCKKCGYCKEWQDPDTPQWSDEVDVSKAYRYKRLSYFIEHLYRLQAKECTIIPDHVISKLLIELRKRRITEPDKITAKLIRGFLKNLDLTNYYDNINSIIRTLSGKEAPEFPEELEDKLVVMFMRTQEPFEKWKHLIPDRNNYLSYPYVIRKLLIIISRTEDNQDIMKFVKWFPLLKSRQKLWHQEKLFEKICEELEWPFFKSI